MESSQTTIIKSLSEIDFDTIYRAFASAFADYDFQPDYAGLQAMLKRRGFDSKLSFAAFNGNEIVSFVLNGIGNFAGILTAYDTGTGTVKEYGGKGLASAIFEYSIPYLKKAGIKQYLLEVLQHNTKAASLYKKQGFQVTREFNYCIQKKENMKSIKVNAPFTIKEIKIEKHNEISAFWDFEPSWQNSLDSINRANGGFISLGAFDGEKLISYCVFEPTSGDITQIATDKQFRRKHAATLLLNEAVRLIKSDKIMIVNTDTSCESFTGFLKSKNIGVSGKQFEMVKELL